MSASLPEMKHWRTCERKERDSKILIMVTQVSHGIQNARDFASVEWQIPHNGQGD